MMNINDARSLLESCFKNFGDETAVTIHGKEVSYYKLEELTKEPLTKAPFFLLRAEKDLKTIIAILSCWRNHIPICPINPTLPEREEKRILEDLHRHAPLSSDTYLLTSGTTSRPKIAMLGLEQHICSALSSHPLWKTAVGDRYLLSLPLFHIAGIMILIRSLLTGATIVICDEKEILVNQITHLSLVTTQLIRLLSLNDLSAFAFLKGILLGGGKIPLSLCKKANKMGFPLFPTYGMTEMNSQIATHYFSSRDDEIYYGPPLKGREVMINELGEILVKGTTLFNGYLGKPIDRNDWLETGDIGTFSLKKGLQIQGRKDRMFISGGENIHPEIIEKALASHPQVLQCNVRGIPDPIWGMKTIAEYASEGPIAIAELKEYLTPFLSNYQMPKEFIWKATGKMSLSL